MFMSWIFLFFLSKTYRRILYLLNADYYMHIPHQSNFYFFKKSLQNTVFHKILLAGWRISGVQCKFHAAISF